MSFEFISDELDDDVEFWICDRCGYKMRLPCIGQDVDGCPECNGKESEVDEA